MQSIKSYLLGSAFLVFLALVLALANADVRRAVAEEFKDVRVINTESQPVSVRDVDNPARQPIHFNESYTVPTGKRLVIEYISVGIGSQTQCDVIAVALSSESIVLHLYHPAFVGVFFGPTSRPYRYLLSQETRAYVGPNRTVNIEFTGYSGCGTGPDFSHVGISGYLVDMQ
jgi:hypothetical protein